MNFTKLKATAQKLISKNGGTVTLRKKTSDVYDPVLMTNVTTTADTSIKATILPASGGKIEALDIRFRNGETTIDQYRYMVTSDATASAGDYVIVGGETYLVIGSTPVQPDGSTVVMSGVALRRVS